MSKLQLVKLARPHNRSSHFCETAADQACGEYASGAGI